MRKRNFAVSRIAAIVLAVLMLTANLPTAFAVGDTPFADSSHDSGTVDSGFAVMAMPRAARAAKSVIVRSSSLDLTKTALSYWDMRNNQKTANPTTADITDAGEGWSWYRNGVTVDGKAYTGLVLVLSGASINSGDTASGIVVPDNTTIVLQKGTSAYIRAGYKESSDSRSGCIYSAGSITFDGTGRLDAVSTGTSGSGHLNGSNGINALVKITVNDGTINSTGTFGQSGFAAPKITINGGIVTAIGAKGATNASSGGGSGLWANYAQGRIELTGGTIIGRIPNNTGGKPVSAAPQIGGGQIFGQENVVEVIDGITYLSSYYGWGQDREVTFETNGGTPVPSQTVKFLSKATKPADPTQDGQQFLGWYRDAELTTPWDFANDTIVYDTTIYAKWGLHPDRDASLTNLFTSIGGLYDFDSEEFWYSMTAANSIGSIKLRPVATNSGATIEIGGNVVASGEESDFLTLSPGSNIITVKVTSKDGLDTKDYTVMVWRLANNNGLLSSLTMSAGNIPSFTPDNFMYLVPVDNKVTETTITPTAMGEGATITVNGESVKSGAASQKISLGFGMTTIKVEVTAQNSVDTATYYVYVMRPQSGISTLNNLSISRGTLLPAFTSGRNAYTAKVENAVTSLTVTPTVTDTGKATVTVNGTPVTSGSPSAPVALKVGSNTINVEITAENGVTTKLYTVTVTRSSTIPQEPTPNIQISGEKLTGFVSGASYVVNGAAVAPDAQGTLPIDTDWKGAMVVVVRLGDGVNTSDSDPQLLFIPATGATVLSNLDVSVGGLSPAFTSDNLWYDVSVGASVSSITVTPTSAQPAKVKLDVNGVQVQSGSPSSSIQLQTGYNLIAVTSALWDESESLTYYIFVERAAPYVPSGGGSSSTPSDEEAFWTRVKEEIEGKSTGSTISIDAKKYTQMPWYVMDALYRQKSGLVIDRDGAQSISIPAGKALKTDDLKVFWLLSELAQTFSASAPADGAVKEPMPEPNPGTGANDFVGLAAALAAASAAGILAVKKGKTK